MQVDDIHEEVAQKRSDVPLKTFIRKSIMYPTDIAIDQLVTTVSQHYLKITTLRALRTLNILVVACDQPILVVEFFFRLCDRLNRNVKEIKILCVDKSVEVFNHWNLIFQQYPSIASSITFEMDNFLHYDNDIMKRFDISVTFATAVVRSFILKWFLLPFQPLNERPYFRSSKLFLAPCNLFDTFEQIIKDNKSNISVRRTIKVYMKSGVQRMWDKDILALTQLQVGADFFKFEFFHKVDECHIFSLADFELQNLLSYHVCESIDNATKTKFKQLFHHSYNLFADMWYKNEILCAEVDKFSYSSISYTVEGMCEVKISFHLLVAVLQCFTPEDKLFVQEHNNHNRRTVTLQNGSLICVTKETSEFIKKYFDDNLHNACVCYLAMLQVKNNCIEEVLTACGASEILIKSKTENWMEDAVEFIVSIFEKSTEIHADFKGFASKKSVGTKLHYLSESKSVESVSCSNITWSTSMISKGRTRSYGATAIDANQEPKRKLSSPNNPKSKKDKVEYLLNAPLTSKLSTSGAAGECLLFENSQDFNVFDSAEDLNALLKNLL